MIVGKPLLTVEQINNRIKELAVEISADYTGKDLLVIGLLKGAFIFMSDLVRQIQVPVEIDFLIASSYHKTESTGDIRIHSDVRESIQDKDVLIIEDIVDTGITLNMIINLLLGRKPASLKVCAMLDKTERRIKPVHIDYLGFQIANEFVVGYGLDYEGKYRNLPYISVFKEER
jgi:hypoxanthine phosphoribosyltransferase